MVLWTVTHDSDTVLTGVNDGLLVGYGTARLFEVIGDERVEKGQPHKAMCEPASIRVHFVQVVSLPE